MGRYNGLGLCLDIRPSVLVARGVIYMCINLDKLECVSFKQTDIQGQLKGERGQTVISELPL